MPNRELFVTFKPGIGEIERLESPRLSMAPGDRELGGAADSCVSG